MVAIAIIKMRKRQHSLLHSRRVGGILPLLFASASSVAGFTVPAATRHLTTHRGARLALNAADAEDNWLSTPVGRRAANVGFVAAMTSLFTKPLFVTVEDTSGLVQRWDLEAAKEAAKIGEACPTVRTCLTPQFEKVQAALDTSSLKKNAIGKTAERMPISYVETQFGAMREKAVACYKCVVVSPLPNDGTDTVELMW